MGPRSRRANPNLAAIAAVTIRQGAGRVPRDFLTAALAIFLPLVCLTLFSPAHLMLGSGMAVVLGLKWCPSDSQ